MQKNEVIYRIPVDGETVIITLEMVNATEPQIMQEYLRMLWRQEHQERRAYRCRDVHGVRCTGSCSECSNAYTSAQDGTSNNSLIQSWNLGKVVWKTPNSTGSCSGSGVYDFTNSKCQAYWQEHYWKIVESYANQARKHLERW